MHVHGHSSLRRSSHSHRPAHGGHAARSSGGGHGGGHGHGAISAHRGQSSYVGGSSGVNVGGLRDKRLVDAMKVARGMGLTVTSTTGGKHRPGSLHYSGRAIDVAGSPAAMARFYRYYARKSPTELFYDPIGGIKNGRQIGAIGGHRDHVHLGF